MFNIILTTGLIAMLSIQLVLAIAAMNPVIHLWLKAREVKKLTSLGYFWWPVILYTFLLSLAIASAVYD